MPERKAERDKICCLRAEASLASTYAVAFAGVGLFDVLLSLSLHVWFPHLFDVGVGFILAAWTLLAWRQIPARMRIRRAEAAERAFDDRLPRSEIDPECEDLVHALNECPGIHTMGSCCGHGFDPFFITMHAESQESLRPVHWSTMGIGTRKGRSTWNLHMTTGGDGSTSWFYVLEGPVDGADDAGKIATRLRQILHDGVDEHIRRHDEYWEHRRTHPSELDLLAMEQERFQSATREGDQSCTR